MVANSFFYPRDPVDKCKIITVMVTSNNTEKIYSI